MSRRLLGPAPDARAFVVGLAAAALGACSYPHFGFTGAADTGPDAVLDASPGADSAADAPEALDTAAVDAAHPDAPRPRDSATTDTPTDTLVADGTDAPADAPSCPILAGGDVCATIHRFTAPKQILDGAGDEFCDVPATRFVVATGAHPSVTPAPAAVDTVVLLRVAWSADALHLHAHVDQAKIYVAPPVEDIWRGDAIEVFVAGSAMLTGPFGPSADGAEQILASPDQSPGSPARAWVYVSGSYSSAVGPSNFGTRMVPGGYEIELQIPWVDLRATPVSGGGVAFNLGVDVRQSADVTSGPLLQSFLVYNAAPASTTCTGGHPSCDDRTWCLTHLE